jgi:uncharacterized protein YndB with AHSA1/START domain/predicted enzyme related to lactoylglutathione lyase
MSEAITAREITIRRVFDAPRELVWKAWTEPERLARWWGKRGWSTPLSTVTMDVRPGGVFRLNSISDEDGREMPLDTVYREVVEPERLAFGDATVTLTDLGDGRTEMIFHTTVEMTDATRRAAEGGLASAFDRLAEQLEPQTPTQEPPMSTTTSIVTGVDFVSVPTSDLTAAMDFYGDVLGLPNSSVWQRPGQEAVGAEFETGTVTIALIPSERLGITFQPNKVPLALQVEDVEAARAELESRGVSFVADTIDSGVCHMAHFEDPDGNSLMIHHRYAPRS